VNTLFSTHAIDLLNPCISSDRLFGPHEHEQRLTRELI
jgi:hypothetical protein